MKRVAICFISLICIYNVPPPPPPPPTEREETGQTLHLNSQIAQQITNFEMFQPIVNVKNGHLKSISAVEKPSFYTAFDKNQSACYVQSNLDLHY